MSVTINGTTGVSKVIGLTGMILGFGNETAPDGWLACDGSAVLRSTYADLFAAIGTKWGDGDGTTTFNLPDMRETVAVGTGTRGTGVTAHDTYDVGEFKDDQMQQITGDIVRAWGPQSGSGAFSLATGVSNRPTTGTSGTVDINFDSADSPDARTGTTSHGKQAGVLYCIKT